MDFNTGRFSSSAKGTVSIRDVRKEDRGNYTLVIDQGSRLLNLKIEVIAFGKSLSNLFDKQNMTVSTCVLCNQVICAVPSIFM